MTNRSRPNILSHLHPWISRWLGYRPRPVIPPRNYTIWIWSFIGTFVGISVIQAVFGRAQHFIDKGVPAIMGSYGATAVLIYAVIESPLAQPRSLIGGHFVGALTGVCVTKLFLLLPTEERFEDLRWLAASLSCAISVVVMQVTGTVHPPGGAAALLATVDGGVRGLGWYYVPVNILMSVIALAVALITNNVQRRYPLFWLTPPVPQKPMESPCDDSPDSRSEKGGVEVITLPT